jgi:(p)ppGpp synthase/HD superfamily hydrolase
MHLTTMTLLEQAIALAVQAHLGQTDKAGQPYILHPLRLMLSLRSEDEQIVAVLHDVVEDTDLTLDALRQHGFPEHVVAAIGLLSKQPGDTYEAFIDRLSGNLLAVRVKLADLADNMNLSRLAHVGDKELARLQRYHAAWLKLAKLV